MRREFLIGQWRVQPDLNTITNGAGSVRLEPKVMEVLVVLAQYAGEVVPKEDLIRSVWPETFVTDDVLIRCISELRKIIEKDPKHPQLLQTIAKRGYRLVVTVEPLVPQTQETTNAPATHVTLQPAATSSPAKQSWAQRHIAGLAIMLGFSGAAIVAWAVWPEPLPVVTGATQLTHDGKRKDGISHHFLAADEHYVYYMARTPNGQALTEVSIRGGEPAVVPNPAASHFWLASFSPTTSEFLAFPLESSEDSPRPLYVLPLPTGGPWRLGNIFADDAGWSADGLKVVYSNGNSLYVAGRDANNSSRLAELSSAPRNFSWSPDGKLIRFYQSGKKDGLWEIHSDGTGLRQVLGGIGGEVPGSWSNDGRYYLYDGFRDQKPAIFALREGHTWRPWRKAQAVQLTSESSLFFNVVMSQDGKRLFAKK